MPEQPKVVFLYTELAGYIRHCLEELAAAGVSVHAMAYPVNTEAPFAFDLESSACRYYRRSDYSLPQLQEWLENIDPQLIVCSGWIDAAYVQLCRNWRGRCKTVLALDNPYPRNAQAMAGLLRARLRYRNAYSHAWVPGEPQVAYAKALGFDPEHIEEGFYCADVSTFAEAYKQRAQGSFARRFIYVGRYVDFKGLAELWAAFAKCRPEGWELHCAGVGPLYDTRPEMPGLRHFGFVQPADLGTFVAEGGIFVLPSHREPWGVVVHEVAAAGLPIICSSAVGASTAFVREGINGRLVAPKDAAALCEAMVQMARKSPAELEEMGRQSIALAATLSPQRWVHTALKLLE